MKVLVLVKANDKSEAGEMPDEQMLSAMMKYNEDLVKAGIMLGGEGLQPSSQGTRVKFSGNKRTVVDGPFAEAKELVAGYWLWQVKTWDEAVEWARRCPNPTGEERSSSCAACSRPRTSAPPPPPRCASRRPACARRSRRRPRRRRAESVGRRGGRKSPWPRPAKEVAGNRQRRMSATASSTSGNCRRRMDSPARAEMTLV